MNLLILCTGWGLEDLQLEESFRKIKEAEYDGIDTWIPETLSERKKFIRLLEEYRFPVVCHQHQAKGGNIKEFCKSFLYYLELSMECNPLFINSHSGKDYFTRDEQLMVIDTAQEFSIKNNIKVVHETHRGRLGFSPYNAMELFKLRPEMKITADLSHWVCVTESYLEHCPEILAESIRRTEHIHARVGYPEGPQVSDPRAAEWQNATNTFIEWWRQIIEHKRNSGADLLTITPEFGPPPYMVTHPVTGLPIADQFEVNSYMKGLLKTLN